MHLIDPSLREEILNFFGSSPNTPSNITFSQVARIVTIQYETEPENPDYYQKFGTGEGVGNGVSLTKEVGPTIQTLDDGEEVYEIVLRIPDES